MFQTLQYPAFIVDQEHCIIAVNAPAQQLHCLDTGTITTAEAHIAHTRSVFMITCAPLPAVNQVRRALVTLVDVSALHHARLSSETSEQRYRLLFEDMPVALREEDFSDIKRRIESVRAGGVRDFSEYCRRHPEFISDCAARVHTRANKAITIHCPGQSRPGTRQPVTACCCVPWI